jgi:thymidylate kinase
MSEFFLLEGGIATGKATVMNEISNIALQNDEDVIFEKTPIESSEGSREWITENANPKTKALWYLSHSTSISQTVEEELEAGNDVLLDRYRPTTVAYHDPMVDADMYEIVDQFDLLEPQTVFYLTVDETRDQGIKDRGRDENRSDETSVQETALKEYEDIFDSLDSQIERINTRKHSPEEIAGYISAEAVG